MSAGVCPSRGARSRPLGVAISGCVSHREVPDPGPSRCPLNELPLTSFIEEVNRCNSGPVAVASATDTGNPASAARFASVPQVMSLSH